MKKILFSIFLGLISTISYSQAVGWASAYGDINGTEEVTDALYAENGYYYITGTFTDSIDFGNNYKFHSQGGTDIFIASIDIQNNKVIHAETFGGPGNDFSAQLAFNDFPNQYLYLSGVFQNYITKKTGNQIDTIYAVNGSQDAFLIEMQSYGNHNPNFLKNISNTPSSGIEISHIEVFSTSPGQISENIYITGSFTDSISFDSISFTQSLGSYDGFVLKMDNNGNYLFSKTIGSSGEDKITSFTYDTEYLFLIGYYSDTMSFYGDGPIDIINFGGKDAFIISYSLDYNYLDEYSLKTLNGSKNDLFTAIDYNSNNASKIVAGHFESDTIRIFDVWGSNQKTIVNTGNKGSSDGIIIQFGGSGYGYDTDYSWNKQITGTNNQHIYDLKVDDGFQGNSDIYISGKFQGNTNFDSNLLKGTGLSHDGFIAKYSGAFGAQYPNDWAESIYGNSLESVHHIDLYNKKILIAGKYTSDINFDQNPDILSYNTATIKSNIFVSQHCTYSFAPKITLTNYDAKCGGNSGYNTTSATNLSANYFYQWRNEWNPLSGSGSSTTPTFSKTKYSLSQGNYQFFMEDNIGSCSVIKEFNLTGGSSPYLSDIAVNPPCPADTNGTFEFDVNGGQKPYTYYQSDYQSGSKILDTTEAKGLIFNEYYDFYAVDSNGCYSDFYYVDFYEDSLYIAKDVCPVNTIGGIDGEASVEVQPNYQQHPYNWTYNWSNGQIGNENNSLSEGKQTVTATTPNGCKIIDSVIIPKFIIDFDIIRNGMCNGDTVMLINKSQLPEFKKFSLKWNIDGENSNEDNWNDESFISDTMYFVPKYGDTYSVNLNLSSGVEGSCDYNFNKTKTVEISGQPFDTLHERTICPNEIYGIEANEVNLKEATWYFSDGISYSNVSNTEIHTYTKSNIGINHDSIVVETKQCGIYSLYNIITVDSTRPAHVDFDHVFDGKNCSDIPASFWAAGSIINAYTWDFGDGSPLLTSNDMFVHHKYDSVGTYFITVSTTNSCGNSDTSVQAIQINDSLNQGVSQYGSGLYIAINGEDSICSGDEINLDARLILKGENQDVTSFYGGMINLTWFFGDGTTQNEGLQAKHKFLGGNGQYVVTVKVNFGCGYEEFFTKTIIVDNASSPQFYNNTIIISDTVCPNTEVSFITESNANVSWDFGDGNSTNQTTPFLNSKIAKHTYTTPGTYSPKVTLSNTCGNTTSKTHQVVVNSSAPITLHQGKEVFSWDDKSQPNENSTFFPFIKTCAPIEFTALVSGTSYSWDFGDGSNPITTTSTSIDHQFYTAGNYLINLTVMSCSDTVTLTKSIVVLGSCIPPLVSISQDSAITCFGGTTSLTANVSGGVAPYTYKWIGSPLQTTNKLINKTAGTYTLVVTDSIGSTTTASYTISQPIQPQITNLTITNPLICGGYGDVLVDFSAASNSPELYVNGNLAPANWGIYNGKLPVGVYNFGIVDNKGCMSSITTKTIENPSLFTIDNVTTINDTICAANTGEISISTISNVTLTYSWKWENNPLSHITSNSASNLESGNYEIKITDSLGCYKTVKEVILPPLGTPILNSVTKKHLSCHGANDGQIILSALGGLNYKWSSGINNDTVSNLSAGHHTVTITSGNGCNLVKTFQINQPQKIEYYKAITPTTICNTQNGDGKIELVDYLNYGYTFNWSSGDSAVSSIDSLATGKYYVTATQVVKVTGYECQKVDSFYITSVSDSIALPTITKNVTCKDKCDGQIAFINPNNDYQIIWQNGKSGNTQKSLCAGVHNVTITDKNTLCSVSSPYFISEPTELVIDSIYNNAIKCNAINGVSEAFVIGGTAPYKYLWSSGHKTAKADSLVSGVYYVSVSDKNGCKKVGHSIIKTNDAKAPNINKSSAIVTDVLCKDDATGSILTSVSGGQAPYEALWSNNTKDIVITAGATTDINSLTAGWYWLSVKSKTGCIQSEYFTINEPSKKLKANIQTTNSNCSQLTGSATVIPSGGTAPYSFVWDNNSANNLRQNLSAGVYSITVKDANNCSLEQKTLVKDSGSVTILVDSIIEARCGINEGAAYVSVSGGLEPYSYNWKIGNSTVLIEDVENLEAGKYELVVSDSNNCKDFKLIDVAPVKPDAQSICVVNVDELQENDIYFEQANQTGLISGYNFYRQFGQFNNFNYIGNVPVQNNGLYSKNGFKDTIVTPHVKSYRYYMTSVDTCGIESEPSEVHQTIHMGFSMQQKQDQVTIYWSDYEGVAITNYKVIEKIGNQTKTLLTVPYVQGTSIYDTTYTYHGGIPFAKYYVEADLASPCSDTLLKANLNSTRSNNAEIDTIKAPFQKIQIDDVLTITVDDVYFASDTICDGKIDVAVSGGYSPIVYLLVNTKGDTVEFGSLEDISDFTIDSLCSSDKYILTVKDNIYPEDSSIVIVKNNVPEIVASINGNQYVPNGACSGFLELEIKGGVLPFTVDWKDKNGILLKSQTLNISDIKDTIYENGVDLYLVNASIDSLCQGVYYFTITDKLGTATAPIGREIKSNGQSVGIVSVDMENLFSVYPNPSSEYINIMVGKNTTVKSILRIIDINGKEVIRKQYAKGMVNDKIDISSLSAGVYHLQININEELITHKVIVE